MTTVLVSPSVSLAKAGKTASITWEMDQKTLRPMMESQITRLLQAALRLSRR